MRKILFLGGMIVLQSCIFLSSSQTKQFKKIESIKPLDVIIVPGLPLYGGKIDTLLKTRILWSEFLYKQRIANNIIYSGNAVYTKWVEGSSMALFAEQLGIKRENILVDTIAEHSTENLFYGVLLAEKMGFKKIGVATDAFQCSMLKKYAKKNIKATIYFLPVVYDSIRTKMQLEMTIDTTITIKKDFVPLEERQGYNDRLKGTRGKHIEK